MSKQYSIQSWVPLYGYSTHGFAGSITLGLYPFSSSASQIDISRRQARDDKTAVPPVSILFIGLPYAADRDRDPIGSSRNSPTTLNINRADGDFNPAVSYRVEVFCGHL